MSENEKWKLTVAVWKFKFQVWHFKFVEFAMASVGLAVTSCLLARVLWLRRWWESWDLNVKLNQHFMNQRSNVKFYISIWTSIWSCSFKFWEGVFSWGRQLSGLYLPLLPDTRLGFCAPSTAVCCCQVPVHLAQGAVCSAGFTRARRVVRGWARTSSLACARAN